MTENKKVISNFFVIEGLDGAGTTTQAKKLATELTDSVFTWEPTNSDFGKMLRQILCQNLPIDKITLAHLFATDRSNHLYNETGILNQCKTHKVFCDRYILSSFAYQSIDVNEEIVLSLNKDFPIPQITFFIDTPVDICMQRIEKRDNREIYEHTELQLKIREKYLKGIEIFKKLGWNINIIDGTKNIDEIFIDICKYL